MNARFWTYLRTGWVKLTLRPGQQLYWTFGGPCEEGYCRGAHAWTFDGTHVTETAKLDQRDCDGRMTQHAEWVAALGELKSIEPNEVKEYATPQWREVTRQHRDFSAEAMGY